MKRELKKFNNLVESLTKIPSIGKKSAIRMAYHMVAVDGFNAMKIAHCIEDAVSSLKKCLYCNGISENEICDICVDSDRDDLTLCIVASAKDILTLEDNGVFDGKYYVLDSITNIDLTHLKKVVEKNRVKEIIFALTPSISTDSIIFFIEDELKNFENIVFTKIAQGVPTGVSIENIDILSLSKAIKDRVRV